jgi:hypothetical protein
MVGDYCSTAFAAGKAFSIFAVANPLSGSLFDEPMYTTTGGFTVSSRLGVASSIGERALASARSDHPARQFYDQEEHRYPVQPPRK